MKVKLDSQYIANQQVFVKFHSDNGTGAGRWLGRKEPQIKQYYNIELNIEPVLSTEQVKLVDKGSNGFQSLGENLVLTGDVAGVDVEDGLIYLRISSDGLLIIEYQAAHLLEIGDKIQVSIPIVFVELYPY